MSAAAEDVSAKGARHMDSRPELRVPWYTHWRRMARASSVRKDKPWHTHFWRGWLSLFGSRKYAPPSAREMLENLLAETRVAHARQAAALDAQAQAQAGLSHSLATAETELRRLRNRTNRIVMRHVSQLGLSDAPVAISQPLEAVTDRLRPQVWPRSREIVVCTMALGTEYRLSVRRCLESQERYCEQHGYSRAELDTRPNGQSRPTPWYKIPLTLQLLQAGYAYVLWMDADCLVTNPEFRLETLTDRLGGGQSMLVALDQCQINSGVLLIRNTPAARRLLDMVWLYDATAQQPNWEQDALIQLMEDHPEVRDILLPEKNARLLNSFPPELDLYHSFSDRPNVWAPGDFVCHFAGIRPPHLERLIDQYARSLAGG